jgi:hypothetical protein
MPYKTTLFGGRIDVGDSGIRAVGVVWLLTALAFFACAGALVLSLAWWLPATLATTVFSLLLCISGWPDSRYGVVANVLILAILLAHGWVGWPPVAVQ